MKKNVILTGPPGAGKNTVGDMLEGFTPWSMSGKLNPLIQSDPVKGPIIKQHCGLGLYVPDHIVTDVIEATFQELQHEPPHLLLIDGLRTFRQASLMLEWLRKLSYDVTVFDIVFDEEDLSLCEERMIKRGRPGETAAVIATRFDEFRTYHPGVAQFLKRQLGTKFVKISGLLEPDQKAKKIKRTIFGDSSIVPPCAPTTP
jgi:adenylate kinase family enzyme